MVWVWVCACDTADYNRCNLRAFQKAGFQIDTEVSTTSRKQGQGDPNNGMQTDALLLMPVVM